MVNVKKFITSKYLAAKNASMHRGKKFVIDAAFADIINENEKVIIRLAGIEQPLALNQTNLSILSAEFGEDTDKWINNTVVLNLVKVTYQGELVDSIQLSPVK